MIRWFTSAIALIVVVVYFVQFSSTVDPELVKLKENYKRPDNLAIYPANNPHSDAKAALGKILFFDPRLSSSDIMGCHSCHNPGFHWTDSLAEPRGKDWAPAQSRKTMTVLNVGSDELILWNGVVDTLEEHPTVSMPARRGTNISVVEVANKLHAIEGYRRLFKEAFDFSGATDEIKENDFINTTTITQALATYERTIFSGDAPFDKWVEGDEAAISESAKRGFKVFDGKGKCASCHTGWNFSGAEWKDIGLNDDYGRGLASSAKTNYSLLFKTKPVGLRNIAERPPYFNTGEYDTLEEVIEFFNRGGNVRHGKSDIVPLNLTDDEKADLVEFLKALTSVDEEVVIPKLPR